MSGVTDCVFEVFTPTELLVLAAVEPEWDEAILWFLVLRRVVVTALRELSVAAEPKAVVLLGLLELSVGAEVVDLVLLLVPLLMLTVDAVPFAVFAVTLMEVVVYVVVVVVEVVVVVVVAGVQTSVRKTEFFHAHPLSLRA